MHLLGSKYVKNTSAARLCSRPHWGAHSPPDPLAGFGATSKWGGEGEGRKGEGEEKGKDGEGKEGKGGERISAEGKGPRDCVFPVAFFYSSLPLAFSAKADHPRMCVFSYAWSGHFQSCDKDCNHTTLSAIAKNLMLHAGFIDSVTERELWLIGRFLTFFAPVTLTLTRWPSYIIVNIFPGDIPDVQI